MFFYSLTYLPEVIDFLTILITHNNIDNTLGYYGVFGYFWIPFLYILGIFLATKILEIKNRNIVRISIIVLGIIFEIFLILDPSNAIIYDYPSTVGERIIYYNFAEDHPLYIISILFLIAILIFCVVGILIKGFKVKGVLRKKYFLISITYLLITTLGVITTLIPPGIFLITLNFLSMGSFCFLYFALREEPLKKEKIKPEKEIKVEAGLFRLSKRPENISEEEISLYKEKKICLICKGSAEGFNIFVCPHCDTLYCRKCATTLSVTENLCWVCNIPIDETKPFKPYKKEKEESKPEIIKQDKLKK